MPSFSIVPNLDVIEYFEFGLSLGFKPHKSLYSKVATPAAYCNANGYISKPFDITNLVEHIRKVTGT